MRPPVKGVCQVWQARVDICDPAADLPAEDAAHVASMMTERAKREAYASRWITRCVLAFYLGCPPLAVRIERGSLSSQLGVSMRPVLAGGLLDFNVTNSSERVLVAVVGYGRIGVDSEPRKRACGFEDMAPHICTAQELIRLSMMAPAARGTALLRLFCRKEAVLKLAGHGLFIDPTLLDVSGSLAVMSIPIDGWPGEPIHIRDLGHDIFGALASTHKLHAVEMLDAECLVRDFGDGRSAGSRPSR